MHRQYYEKNFARIIQTTTQWNKDNPEKHRKYSQKYRDNNLDKLRRARLKKLGWTLERVEQKLVEQNNSCKICKEIFTGIPCADDKHADPPKPRSLLCHNCNRALGMLKDNPELCKAAADYLEEWSKDETRHDSKSKE